MSYDPSLSAYAADHGLASYTAGPSVLAPYRCGYTDVSAERDCDRGNSGRKNECRRQVALNANSGGVGPLPILTTTLSAPLNVVSTSIDTRGMGQTNNLLNFTSTVALPIGVVVTLNFEIARTAADGSTTNVGATYTFSTIVTVLEAEAFSFQFFDTDVAPGAYTYSIRLSTNTIISVTPGVTINNAVLSVLAVSADQGKSC